jgi:hypothetical protein
LTCRHIIWHHEGTPHPSQIGGWPCHVHDRDRAGSLGGHTRAAALTPEQRRSSAKKARLSGLVNAVARRVDELSDEQKDKLLNTILGMDQDDNLDGAA